MDSLRSNNGQKSNGYSSNIDPSGNGQESDVRKTVQNDGFVLAPRESSTSTSASSLRPSGSRGSVASPYLKAMQIYMDNHDDGDQNRGHREPVNRSDGISLKPAADSLLTRSAVSSSSPAAFTLTSSVGSKATVSNSVASSTSSSIYGTKNTKRSLEDDDPSDSAANIMDHLTLSSSSASAHSFTKPSGRRIMSTTGRSSLSSAIKDNRRMSNNSVNGIHSFSSGKISSLSPGEYHVPSGNTPTKPNTNLHTSSDSPWTPMLTKSNENDKNPSRIARPKNDEDYNYDDEHIGHGNDNTVSNESGSHSNEINNNSNTDYDDMSQVVHSDVSSNEDDFIPLAKEHTRALMSAAMPSVVSSKSDDLEPTPSYIRNLMECCKKDQETLQGKLSEALEEEAVATAHLMEQLISLSDEICAAIEAGEDALKCEKERTKKKKVAEGPTIELLEENRDVFSLICMLRAPNEKRMQAALALMKFAKDDQVLRDEIISSGGIHSFLTLFQQTRGMSRELKVVSSLAVAHILPSYVASSQTTSSIGLKLVECLHFLAKSNPVSPNGIVITIEEMCVAASVGVNVLWINSIQPLIAMKKVKEECTSSPPSLRPGKTVRYGRLRSRTG